MNVTSTTQTNYTQTTNKDHRAEQNTDTEYKQNDASVTQSTDTQSNQNKSPSLIKNFLNDLSSNESTSFKSSVIKETIENKVNKYAQLMMDERGTATESKLETSKLLNEYKKELLQEYKLSIENSTDTVMSAEQEAIIKVLMKENTQETSSLEALLATKGVEKTGGVTETTIAQDIVSVYKNLFTADELDYYDKYKDTFYPMPSSFSQEVEDLQTKIIREKYPDFLPMDEALEKFGFKADPNNPETTEQKAIREEANRQFILDHGGQEAWDEESAFIRSVYRKYPNNFADKWHDVPNAKERANVFNAGVYEGLEEGKPLQKAIGDANNVISWYLDNNEILTQQFQGSYDFFIGGDEIFTTPDMEDSNNKKIIYDGYTLDLRKYGFDRDLQTRRIYNDESKMITSIQNRLDYANFLIDNPEIVQKEFDKIVEKTLEERGYDYTEDHDIYKDYINPSKEQLPTAELALKIFSNYKIF